MSAGMSEPLEDWIKYILKQKNIQTQTGRAITKVMRTCFLNFLSAGRMDSTIEASQELIWMFSQQELLLSP